MWVTNVMKLRYAVSPAAIEMIKRFEGLRRTAAQLDDGRWTVGYGHTRSAREGAEVSEADAEALLGYDLVDVQAAVNDWTFTPLTQNEFDALASFVFNIGLDAFRHSSVLRRINEGAMLQAACAMEMWRKADFEGERIVVDALIRRRAAEKALFLTPLEGFVAAPSAVVRPQMDYGAGAAVPRVRPTDLKTDLEGETATLESAQVQTPPVTETEVSASERAVAAVSARLQAIWPNEDEAVEAKEEPEEPEPFPTESVPEPVEPLARSETRPSPAALASVRSIFDQTRDEPDHPSFTPLVILGVIGFLLFGGGIYQAFVSRPSTGLIGSSIIGFGIGILGILCVATAVYFLLERLGGDKD
jgi:lysozyme